VVESAHHSHAQKGEFCPRYTYVETSPSQMETLTGTGLPLLVADTKARLERIASSPNGITDPFDSVYKIVFQLTMRTVGCNEIADDPTLLAQTLAFFEIIEQTGTPARVIFPWLPTLAKLKRTYAGAKLYFLFQRIVNERTKTGTRENDALQFMIDKGDNVQKIIAVSTDAGTGPK
jgi:hypothetical protein